MQILVNGDPREVDADTTVALLVAEIASGRRHVAVEVNREIVPRSQHGQRVLREGDRVELVTAIGGG